MKSGIEFRQLSRSFGSKFVFNTDSFRTLPIGFVIVKGPNGSGKTSLLRILSTLLSPSQGDALVGGHSILLHPKQVRQQISFVSASDGGFYPRLTGLENLYLFAGLQGLNPKQIEKNIDELTETLNLREILKTPFIFLSSGMKQSLALTRSFIKDSEVLFVDEPSRSLDQKNTERFHELLRHKSEKKLVLMASHDHQELSLAKQVLRLEEGRLFVES